MDEKVKVQSKYFIMIIVFAVTALMTYVVMGMEQKSQEKATMSAATFPVVMMETESGTCYNALHGYADNSYPVNIADSVTPLSTDKRLKIRINTYQADIQNISYTVRRVSDASLMENTQVTDYTTASGYLEASLNIKNLLEDNEPYLLEIHLHTAADQDIYYVTNIQSSGEVNLEEKLAYVDSYVSWLYDKDQWQNVYKQLESKSSSDNSNYGNATLYNSRALVTWSTMNPILESPVIPTLTAIDAKTASFDVQYEIAAANTQDGYDNIEVQESYALKTTANGMYVTSYARKAYQTFTGAGTMASASRIDLGIQADDSFARTTSPDSHTVFFVNNGNLWSFQDQTSSYTQIFSFSSSETDGVRENYNAHKIRILQTDNSGNCTFMVYGYMNRGEHEGETGVSVFSYNNGENTVTEKLFLPISGNLAQISAKVGDIAYTGSNDVFYLKVDQTLYAIDMNGHDVMVEADNLQSGNFAASKDGTMVAFTTNGSVNEADSIKVIQLSAGRDFEIKADEGDSVKVIGFVQDDFVYGTGHRSDLVGSGSSAVLQMYALRIVDADNTLLKQYDQEGVYISDASVSNLRISLSRTTKNGEQDFSAISSDQIISKEENASSAIHTGYISSDDRLNQLSLYLANKASNYQNAASRAAEHVLFNDNDTVQLP